MSYYDVLENEEEIQRHHRDFAAISELSEEAEKLISVLPIPRDNTKRDELAKCIRSIRNIVG